VRSFIRTTFICRLLYQHSTYIRLSIVAIVDAALLLNLRTSASLLNFLGRICILSVCHFFGFLILPADVLFINPKHVAVGYKNIQGVPRLVDITAGGNFLGLCDQKSSYKHVSDFGRLRSYGHF